MCQVQGCCLDLRTLTSEPNRLSQAAWFLHSVLYPLHDPNCQPEQEAKSSPAEAGTLQGGLRSFTG
jgi:hypothetical protein